MQRRLTPAAFEWKSLKNEEKLSAFQTKIETTVNWFDKKLYVAKENLFNKINGWHVQQWWQKQNQQQDLRDKPTQFLWNSNPYLDVLNKELQSNDNWYNLVEAEFVQRSIWQRSRNTNLIWGITISVTLGLSVLTLLALNGQRNALIGQIRANRQSAEANLPNQELNALLDSLRAGISLKDWPGYLFKPDTELQPQVLQTLRKTVYVAKERNRVGAPQGFKKMFFAPDGNLLIAIAGDDGIVYIQDLKGNKRSKLFLGHKDKDKVTLDISRDGHFLATVDEQRTIRLWNLEKIQEERPKFVDSIPELCTPEKYCGFKFSPDGKKLVVSLTEESKSNIYLWDLSGDQPKLLKSDKGNFEGINFNSNSQLILAKKVASTLQLSDFMTGKPLAKFTNFTDSVAFYGTSLFNFYLSPNGQKLAAIFGSTEDNISSAIVGNLNNESLNKFTKLPDEAAASVNFDTSGKLIIGQENNGTISIYNSDSNKSPLELKGHQGSVIEVIPSSDGKRLASRGSDNTIRLWDIEDKPVTQLKSIPNLKSINFSPDGKQLAVVESNNTVRLGSNAILLNSLILNTISIFHA